MSKAKTLPFSDTVRLWRERHRLTKVDAAHLLGVPYRTFQSWELGDREPRGIARRLIVERLSRTSSR